MATRTKMVKNILRDIEIFERRFSQSTRTIFHLSLISLRKLAGPTGRFWNCA